MCILIYPYISNKHHRRGHLADTVLMNILGTMIIKKPPSPSKLQPAETLHCMEKMPGFLQQASALLANYSTSQSWNTNRTLVMDITLVLLVVTCYNPIVMIIIQWRFSRSQLVQLVQNPSVRNVHIPQVGQVRGLNTSIRDVQCGDIMNILWIYYDIYYDT